MRPIPYDDNLPVLEPPESGMALQNKWNVQTFLHPKPFGTIHDDQYVPEDRSSETKRFNQQGLNDLNRDLSLSKDKAELLVSGLKERYLSGSYVRVCHYRIWNNGFKIFFGVEGPMVFYHDFKGHFRRLKQEQNSSDCQLVIDSLQ